MEELLTAAVIQSSSFEATDAEGMRKEFSSVDWTSILFSCEEDGSETLKAFPDPNLKW